MRAAVFAFANVTAQLTGGEPLSPDAVFNAVTETYPFGLPNAATSYYRALAPPPVAKPGGGGLVAMADYATESIFDLLAEESLDSRSISSIGSHHLSLESHMGKMNKTPAPPPLILSEPSKYITQCSGKFWGAGI